MTVPRWLLADIAHTITATGYKHVVKTNTPCHLWLRWTTTPPRTHSKAVLVRGLRVRSDVYFCFVVYKDNEQDEAGDTLEHTFIKEPWDVCETRYFYFHGTVGGQFSPSTTAIFTLHRTAPPPPTRYFPDLPPEVSSVAGSVANLTLFQTWAQSRDGAGTNAWVGPVWIRGRIRRSGAAAPANFYEFFRGIMLYDLSPALGYTVATAKIGAWGQAKQDNLNIKPALNIFTSNPASNTNLIPADYGTLGTTPLATQIGYDDWVVDGWNTFTINAAGLIIIQAALNSDGIVKLSLREAKYDALNVEPWPGQKNRILDMPAIFDNIAGTRSPYLELTWA